jgi:hypothetical protein
LQHCRIELNDVQITFDDVFHFSFDVAGNIPVLCINDKTESEYISKLFSDSLFVFKSINEKQLDFSSLATNRFIILNELKAISSGLAQEMKKFISNGGSLLVFPSADAELNSYKEFCVLLSAGFPETSDTADTKVSRINTEHEIYKNVFDKNSFNVSNLDLPLVLSHYRISTQSRSSAESLLKLQNGSSFLSAYRLGKGRFYFCASPLNESAGNFARHAIFVPTLYQMAIYSQDARPLFHTIGKDESIETSASISKENVFHLKDAKNSFDIIPEHQAGETGTKILPHGQITEAGSYDLYAGSDKISGVSYNYDRRESVTDHYNAEDLNAQISSNGFSNISVLEAPESGLTGSLTELDQGKRLWKLCVVLALLFLAAEVLLLRYMK